ncbi:MULTISPECIES: anti-sigma factor family protein [Streptomyces]|uniref:anti-sigma factor family protein n=1 Tax=Streptomyces TaxID=1883 RepID=UPI0003A160D4|nr:MULTISPECIES: zf-HC2 domain-containing protein [Streptomyces]MBZ6112137.1 zf-HC2 domain-containing protein [Streptomyces olivaceus]MBZ6125407.1 zf-HC2 domain-containing protein [Streptomyces olivaceus]MBZ6146473.1 zf-HC2 domain-containing protein [Streptomyces olivaceus]MBZ6160526.1 zf-HC2 domain-containing protein [Streptomyces olivaceus]MBZ6187872.1 zf-HC2 domain-containing protein [Streptomyces olivaceus]
MNCGDFVDSVTAFLDGAMDEATELRFLTHLTTCGDCETCFDQFRQTITILSELPEERLATAARNQLLGAFGALRRD